ncbi:MAG: hypothetical protein KF841_15290 [Phycisphaerae bacterium]|nr:hypothetical protein [Phycisphaerae bacterium]
MAGRRLATHATFVAEYESLMAKLNRGSARRSSIARWSIDPVYASDQLKNVFQAHTTSATMDEGLEGGDPADDANPEVVLG